MDEGLTRLCQIIRVTYPNNFQGKQFRMAYVEFGDEEAMKAGLDKHAEVCSGDSVAQSQY